MAPAIFIKKQGYMFCYIAIPSLLWYCVVLEEEMKMQKGKILRELYHGNLNPVAKSVVQDSDYQKAMQKISTLEEKLMEQLNDEQRKILQK